MNRRYRFAFSVTLGLQFVAATNVVAQNAAVADKPAVPAAPLYDKSSPGVGPIRAEDWFVKTWNDRRAKFADQKAQQEHAIVFFGDFQNLHRCMNERRAFIVNLNHG